MTPSAAREVLEALAKRVPGSAGRVRLSFEDGLAWLRLDNPEAHNAVTVRMMCDLAEAVERLSSWKGQAVVLCSSTPGMFCAGSHLAEVQSALSPGAAGRDMALAMGALLDQLLTQPALVVGAVEGTAVGGGAEIVTACDFRVLHRDARVHFVHARLGVAPGWGGTGRLVAHLGRAGALRALTAATPMTAEEALGAGFADAVVDGPAIDGALKLLEPLRALPAAATRAVKAQVVAANDPKAQAERFCEVWGGPDHRAALEAMWAKRRSRIQ
ncbi:MAG: enoyl-CoA hydratase/isomerase family protein [Deltaproteobacteria bacterium]|nr:enoyl-CoA hydratase/isomerase family protein [Deltaproteobacteria bacterium]MBW2257128.1 enoyl-CoA hydratase/isomerase family protein [Deltaproteobacteria bacterium]